MQPRQLSEGNQVGGGDVGQRIGLQVTPEVLHRVKFRSIGREKFKLDAGMALEPATKVTRPMAGEVIPKDDQGQGQMAQQLAQKVDKQRSSDIFVGMQTKVKGNPVPRGIHTERSEYRNLLVRSSPLPQDGSLSAGSPAAADQRGHQQAALVEEDQKSLQSPGFFLMRGQSRRIQLRMAPSSRSRARRCGFWGLQPRPWSKRPI